MVQSITWFVSVKVRVRVRVRVRVSLFIVGARGSVRRWRAWGGIRDVRGCSSPWVATSCGASARARSWSLP